MDVHLNVGRGSRLGIVHVYINMCSRQYIVEAGFDHSGDPLANRLVSRNDFPRRKILSSFLDAINKDISEPLPET